MEWNEWNAKRMERWFGRTKKIGHDIIDEDLMGATL
jgi:hypothetical protein